MLIFILYLSRRTSINTNNNMLTTTTIQILLVATLATTTTTALVHAAAAETATTVSVTASCPFQGTPAEANQAIYKNITGASIEPNVAKALAMVFATPVSPTAVKTNDASGGAVREQANLDTMTKEQAEQIVQLSKQAMGNMTAAESVSVMNTMAPMLNPETGVSVKLAAQFNQGGAAATSQMVDLPDSILKSMLDMYGELATKMDGEEFEKMFKVVQPMMKEMQAQFTPEEMCNMLIAVSGMLSNPAMSTMINGFLASGTGGSALTNLNPASICPIMILTMSGAGVTMSNAQCESIFKSVVPALAEADLSPDTVGAIMTMMKSMAPVGVTKCTPDNVANMEKNMNIAMEIQKSLPEGIDMGDFFEQVGLPLSKVKSVQDVKVMVGTMAKLTTAAADQGTVVDEATMNILLSMLWRISQALDSVSSEADKVAISQVWKNLITSDQANAQTLLEIADISGKCFTTTTA